MADREATIVIKKKKGGGGHGHHGGAWKVAYADFVTAMMCFFLVMWLMGADEETKQAIEHYFNHPNTPWKAGGDPKSEVVNPLGEREGQGDSVLKGGNGLYPEDLIEMPRSQRDLMKESMNLSHMIEDLMEGKVYGMDANQDRIRFSLPERILFSPGSSEFVPGALKELELLGGILKNFKGYITIEGHTDESPLKSGRYRNNWELSLGRALTVMDYLIKAHGMAEARLYPIGSGDRRGIASNDDPKGRALNRRVEFILSYDKPI